ncbi:hypothetical protein OQA88_7750 [Cercophora sp. LCS_1]
MVHANLAASAVAASTSAASASTPSRPQRLPSSGSFHAGAPFPLSPYDESAPTGGKRRKSTTAGIRPLRRQSTHRYHTFPTPPPKTPSEQQPPNPDAWFIRPPSHTTGSDEEHSDDHDHSHGTSVTSCFGQRRRRSSCRTDDSGLEPTPLPWKQLGLLAILSLAEQTALNSIGPYLPTMVASFDEIPDGEEGLYVGLLASAFALAQLTTNLLWGYLSDRIGRKPVMLMGTALLMVCFVFFGLCRNYVQLISVHIAMGLLNGNAAVVPTCLGEVTDRTNQSKAFTWLPVMYSLGSITGPALGGLLVGQVAGSTYPFLAPNILGASLLLASVVVVGIWFEETLDGADKKAAGAGLARVASMFGKLCGCFRRKERQRRLSGWSARWPTNAQVAVVLPASSDDDTSDDNSGDESRALLAPTDEAGSIHESGDAKLTPEQKSAFRQLVNRRTLTVLVTYLVFQLSNISFSSLYPIFASAAPPHGRDLGPSAIGLSLSLAGLVTIMFQLTLFQPLKARMGNLGTYRWSLLGFVVSMALMPWIGYKDDSPWLGLGSGKAWLYSELGVILVIKNICAVGGLSSVMLLINNSAPSHETLGTLNGIAQSLSAAGRSVGPFLSGGLFTLSRRVRPKGEALAWGLFAGIALLGWVGTLMIRGSGLESADWMGNDDDDDDESESTDDDDETAVA